MLSLDLGIAQIIKSQRQKVGFNLKIRKAKQPSSYFYLRPKWQSCLKEYQNETEPESWLLLSYILP